jgi:hypothetical protein
VSVATEARHQWWIGGSTFGRRRSSSIHRRFLAGIAVWTLGAAVFGPARAEEPVDESIERLFNWDLISLEQNNPRFNASVLTGFHSIRSPGVTPTGGWKLGLGGHFTREEQVANTSQVRLFNRNQILLSPKLNYGFFQRFEAGVGATGGYAVGHELSESGGTTTDDRVESFDLTSIDLGIKWLFWDGPRFRSALSFDTRLARHRGTFGNLPSSFYNVELDLDFAVTGRFVVVGNLQVIASDSEEVRDQIIADIGGVYSFSDSFRGMLFATIQEDDAARTVLGFIGIAGQYVFGQHSITMAFDIQLNDAGRADARTQEQIDVELSYTFTF